MARIIQIENGKLTRQFFIDDEHISIGRSGNSKIQLEENIISAQHAEIFIEKDHHGKDIYFLMDLNSRNGSYVNHNKISCQQLKHKDRIRFGGQKFTFIDDRAYLDKK